MACYYLGEEYNKDSNGEENTVLFCALGGSLISAYCTGTSAYCPKQGGDDRYRRDDALTEDVSAHIAESFKKCLDDAAQNLRMMLAEAAELIEKTDYELLRNSYNEAGKRRIAFTLQRGIYANIVKSDMERRQSEILENEMQGALEAFEPADLLPWISEGEGYLEVSGREFDRLDTIFSQFEYVDAGLQGGVNADGISEYEEIGQSVLEQLSNEVYLYLNRFRENFYENRRCFENGIYHTVQASESGVHGYKGEIPNWETDFI